MNRRPLCGRTQSPFQTVFQPLEGERHPTLFGTLQTEGPWNPECGSTFPPENHPHNFRLTKGDPDSQAIPPHHQYTSRQTTSASEFPLETTTLDVT